MGQVWWLRTHSDILQSSCDAKVLALFMVRQFQCEPLWTMQHHMCRKGTVQCCKFRSPLALLWLSLNAAALRDLCHHSRSPPTLAAHLACKHSLAASAAAAAEW